ncbi:ATPase, T2SS/T4P/T4SS family [Aeromonas caviae]|uniref:GspE/PulE family protein n=1 Tax=Aeromonas caviae TaxID=648 RepID=UPI0033056DD5
MAQPRLKMRLGDLLVAESIISDDQLQMALQQQRQTGRKLGTTLVDLGFIGEEQLLKFLAQQLNVPFFDLSKLSIQTQAVQLIPEVHARRYRALAVNQSGDEVTVVMSDPADLAALDALAAMLSPRELKLAVARETQLLQYFDQLYRRTKEIESFAEQLQEEYQATGFDLGMAETAGNENEATVVKLLRSVFEDAVQVHASDIHIEPDEKVLRIRQRIDGVLHESVLNEVRIAPALVLRLKLVAGLDISEKRLPQDGRFNMRVRGHEIDVRISTMPVQHGESVVMRLLDQSAGLLSLHDTGMPEQILQRFRRQLRRPHGMIVVTGPTGSGKTTTLYGALSELNQPGNKIITVEDPVEYRLPRINQVQVNPKIGLDFSNVLRATLRQDPDILLVGEMRDQETVEIGLRGAMTGHLVLTTLHTNDAISSALRLMDMGAQGYLVASALRAIIAQRLVRRICRYCHEEHEVDAGDRIWLVNLFGEGVHQMKFQHGRGCQSCNFTGYAGRIGVFELLELDLPMMDALRRNDPEAFARAAREHVEYRPLVDMAFEYATQGITTVDEVLRLAEVVS